MLANRLRRLSNIKTVLVQHPVFAGKPIFRRYVVNAIHSTLFCVSLHMSRYQYHIIYFTYSSDEIQKIAHTGQKLGGPRADYRQLLTFICVGLISGNRAR